MLIAEGDELKRCDYSAQAWQGPPTGTVGWWKSQMPDQHARRAHWAPNDVLLNFFDELAEKPDKQDMRYVLALLLVRRRVMRMEEEQHDEAGGERLMLYCPRRDAQYEVPAVRPIRSGWRRSSRCWRSCWRDDVLGLCHRLTKGMHGTRSRHLTVDAGTGDARRAGWMHVAAPLEPGAGTAAAGPSGRGRFGTGNRGRQPEQRANPVAVQQFGHDQRAGLPDAEGPHCLSAAAQFPAEG